MSDTAEVGLHGRPSTGDDQVDQALTRLDELADAPVRDHVGAFEAVHAALHDRLADAEGA